MENSAFDPVEGNIPLDKKNTDESEDKLNTENAGDEGCSTRSVHSSTSRVSMSPYRITTSYAATQLYAYQSGAVERALEVCKKSVITPEEDGDFIGSWLLADIDHWDFEREKFIILTANSLLNIRYDFVAAAVKYFRRISLNSITSVNVGDFAYPSFSFMGGRDYGGLRIHWSKEEPWFYQRWNPWCGDLGYTTLAHHYLIYNEKELETVTYNVSDFADSLVQAVNARRRQSGQNDMLEVKEGPITIYSYANPGSVIYNQSHLGFNMNRGGIIY